MSSVVVSDGAPAFKASNVIAFPRQYRVDSQFQAILASLDRLKAERVIIPEDELLELSNLIAQLEMAMADLGCAMREAATSHLQPLAKVHPGEDDAAPYVEVTVNRILDKLRHCQKSQDATMNNTAFALGRKIAGDWPGMVEHVIKARFMDACGTLSDLPSNKGKWTPRHFEEKWQRGMRDGRDQPDPWPPKGYKPHGSTSDFWRKLFDEAKPLTGTLGEKYFRDSRGVDPSRATLLRFHPAVSCSEKGKSEKNAAIMTAYRTAPDAEPIAMHVTYVGTNGTKPALDIRKRTFGKFGGTGAALYLMPVGPRTIVAEGIEKTLKGMNVTGLPGIAAGGAPAMKSMAIADAIDEELIILADRGKDGELSSKILARRAHAKGLAVRRIFPPVEDLDWDECSDEDVCEAINNALLWEPGPEPDDEPEPVSDGKDESLPSGVYVDKGEAFMAPDWLVKDMVLRRGTGLVIGQSGAGKTPIAIGLGTAMAAAHSFFGRDVKEACGVIYFSAEGAGQIRLRMRAAKLHLGVVTGEIPFACITKPHNLSDDDERDAFIKLCKETAAWLKARFCVETCLVIIDTAMQAFAIEDENDAAKIGEICKLLADIGRALDCFAMVVVHAGKNMSAGARGSSAWRDNVDIALFVSGDRDEVKGTCENRALSQTKNRDGPEGPIAAFDLKLMELGKDADGDPFGAMAVEPNLKRPATAEETHKWTDAEIIFRDAFNEVAIVRKTRIRVGPHSLVAVEVAALREEFCKRYATGEDKETSKDTKTKAFRRALANTFLLNLYPRGEREGVEWIWSKKDEPDADE